MSPSEPTLQRVDVAGTSVYVAVPETGGAAEPRRWDIPRAAVVPAAAVALLGPLRWGASSEAVIVAGMLSLLAVLAAVDLRWRLVPNRIVGPAFVAVLAFRLATDPADAVEWIAAALAAPLFLLLPSLAAPGAMGMGDVKLAAVLGAGLGGAVLSALVLGFLCVFPVALVLLIRRGRARLRGSSIPFVPFLALGAAAVLLA